MPGVAFPPVGPLGLRSPPSSVVCSAKTATLPLSGHFACRSRPDTLPASVRSWCPVRARARVEAPAHARAFDRPSPIPALWQGDRGLSHVPERPLWRHAPLLDPGGVLRTRPRAPRTVAFRCMETVGFPLPTFLEGYPAVHNSTHFGAQSRGLPPRLLQLRTPITGRARGVRS